MNGCLSLRAGLRHGRTVLLEAQGAYPLQVLRPHAGATGGSCGADAGLSLVILLLSGGLLDGDRVAMRVTLEAGARLALRTQAATQVHAGRSSQTLEARLGQGACFSYVPHCVVPHAGADFSSRTEVRMQPGARALVAEALAPGRVRHGESFAYRQVRLDLDAWCGARLVARERGLLRPDATLRPAQFGPATHTAGVYVLGPGPAPLAVAPEAAGAARTGCTELATDGDGWYVRAAARRAADIDDCLAKLHAEWWRS